MARAIIGGLIAKEAAKATDILVIEPDPSARLRLLAEHGVRAVVAPGPELAGIEVVILAVKPQNMREAALKLAGTIADPLFITIAAGIRIADLSRWLGGRKRIVRAMPNTPALVHAGITGLHAPAGVGEPDRAAAQHLLAAVGATLWFEEEGDLDAVVAVSGSGPAYVFYAIEALETAARSLGLAEGASRSLALWTFVGATKLAIERGEDPATLRAQVTSKGGTTERALEVLEAAGVRQHFIDAVKAASERSRELGDALGKD
ncbi:MAG: pyrroline-5-carboxylate reductase [Pseudomonadota bacterium]|nr:pyrroline-5-carboxylate reductase [Pseudomonadota bacterium]